jgi:hypothetical protein
MRLMSVTPRGEDGAKYHHTVLASGGALATVVTLCWEGTAVATGVRTTGIH